MEMVKISSSKEVDYIEPPTFQLPEGFNANDYELWAVRVPVKFDMNVLNDTTLQLLEREKTGKTTNKSVLTSFKVSNHKNESQEYSFMDGHVTESNCFRVLKPLEKGKPEMEPMPMKFEKHINLTRRNEISEMDLAPSIERAPLVNEEDVTMRVAYEHVEQKKGLKRRWEIFGSGTNDKYDPNNEKKQKLVCSDNKKPGTASIDPQNDKNVSRKIGSNKKNHKR